LPFLRPSSTSTKWLGHGPALLPVGEARMAVIDAAGGMALTLHVHVAMKVKAASECWAKARSR